MAIQQGNQNIFPLTTSDGGYNMHTQLIQAALSKAAVATLVVVTGVDDVNKVCNVKPLVSQVTGLGKAIPHGIIYNMPYLPLHFGNNAILMTPSVNDIGLCVFCHNDISNVKATKKESLPASGRRNSYSDGIYIGGLLNPAPTNYIEFKDNEITLKATTFIIDANVESTGTFTNNGVDISSTHIHELPERGTFTDPPQ